MAVPDVVARQPDAGIDVVTVAGADCGFSSRAGFTREVHPSAVWENSARCPRGALFAKYPPA